MPLPSGSDYNAAIQNPTLAFDDPDLKGCTAEQTPLGLPKPYAGGFTTTYHLRTGNRHWAVRCFTRDIPDLKARYRSISDFLGGRPDPPFVKVQYLDKGIMATGQWRPVIKMEWVHGLPLNLFIARNITTPGRLAALPTKFLSLVRVLEKRGIAHGDLQHGNIMVKGNDLYLVDYDGMYVPELRGRQANEIGHVNYQHRSRDNTHYDPTIDRYSSIVIYVGLLATAVSPALWRMYDNSENILFTASDFLHPDASHLLSDMRSIPQVADIADRFARICHFDFGGIPTLSQFVSGAKLGPVVSTAVPWVPRKSQYPVVAATAAASLREHIGHRIEVVGQITDSNAGTTYKGDRRLFLNFGIFPRHTFTLVFWAEGLAALARDGVDPNSYANNWVAVTGVVSHHTYGPEIVIEMPSQIQILSGAAEANERLGIRQAAPPAVSAGEILPQTPHLVDNAALRAPASCSATVGQAAPVSPMSTVPSTIKKPALVSQSRREAEVFDALYGNRPASLGANVKRPPPPDTNLTKHPPGWQAPVSKTPKRRGVIAVAIAVFALLACLALVLTLQWGVEAL